MSMRKLTHISYRKSHQRFMTVYVVTFVNRLSEFCFVDLRPSKQLASNQLPGGCKSSESFVHQDNMFV